MPATYEPIASQTLGSTATSVTFSSIPSTYTDLRLVAYLFHTLPGTGGTVRFNNDSGSNYSRTFLIGDGSTASSGRSSNSSSIIIPVGDPHVIVLDVFSYANTNVFKTVLWSSAEPGRLVARVASLWRSTSAVDRLDIAGDSSGFTSGSTFSLYGIKAA